MSGKTEEQFTEKFKGRVGLQQRVLPSYRVPFFDTLADMCSGGLEIFVGEPLEGEGITPGKELLKARLKCTKNHHLFNPLSPLYICWQDGFRNWLESWKPDSLILEANPRYLSSYFAFGHMHKRGKPVIGWGLGAPQLTGVAGILVGWERKLFLKQFDGLISYSHKGAQEYRQVGFPLKNIFVAPNAVAHKPMNPLPVKNKRKNSHPVVLFVGRLQARKRVDLLIRACSNLPVELQPWLIIVGDGPARFELEKLAGEVYPKTGFLGALRGEDLEPIFNKADLFVLPGTGGLAVQEAMANGLPVIVAQGDGTQGDMVRPENGWQIPTDNLQALITTLEEALSDIDALRQRGIESYLIVQREINIENMAAVFIKALNSVIRNNKS